MPQSHKATKGFALFTYYNPYEKAINPGTYPIEISFNGTDYYNPHVSGKNLTINYIDTQIIVNQNNYEFTW